MASNAQKTPLNRGLNKITENRIAQALQTLGRALPSQVVSVGPSGSIVTVSLNVKTTLTLPQITIPVAMPEYIRLPLQVGDYGLTIPADVLLGASTGLGAGVPLLGYLPANLQGLLFLPYGSSNFSATDDPDAIILYGPNGWIIRDKDNNCSIVGDQENVTVTAKTQIVLKVGDNATVTIKDGEIDLDATTIKFNGIVWGTHEHTGVATGSAKTGGPTAP